MTKLYDIPSLPYSMLKLKTIKTDGVFYDPNTVDNFMKDAIRDRGCDRPVFEHELPRQNNNMLNSSIMNMFEFGSRYKRDPYHPELFLGDLTKDPRQSDPDPIVANMREQNAFRYNRYIRGKLQDDSEGKQEGMVGSKRMLHQIKDGYNDTATRLTGLFDESFGTIISAANPKPGRPIHTTEESIREDQQIYQVNDERILPKYSTDIVSKLNNMVGLQWQIQPDARYGLSSVSNVYRSKTEVDQAAEAVFRLGKQETEFKTEKEQFKTSTTVPQKELIKIARRNYQEVAVDLANDSTSIKNEKSAALPENISRVLETLTTQAVADHKQTGNRKLKQSFSTKNESLIEDIKTHDITDTIRPSTIPTKDRLAIVKKIERMQSKSKRTEDTEYVKKINTKILAMAFKHRDPAKQEQSFTSNKDQFKTSSGVPNKNIDHVKHHKLSKKKFANYNEYTRDNMKKSMTLAKPTPIENFDVELDPTLNNKYSVKGIGPVQKMMSTLSSRQVQDSIVSPLNDTLAPLRTNYT